MESKEQEIYFNRQNKNQIFDKRLIKEIVKAVEEGLPRRQAIATHGMSPCTLGKWMSTYGSAAYHDSKRRSYNSSQKRSILRAIESGMTIKEAQISFGVKNVGIIGNWVREAKQENNELGSSNSIPMANQSENKKSDEVKALQQALAEAQLKIKALDTMIDIAEEQLKINIRKKSGARQSQK